MENAAIVCRVSSEAQLDNSSPEAQLERCRAYCAQRGYTVVTEKIEAVSGAFVLARSEFTKVLDMAAMGQITVIVADIPDRMGRGDTIAVMGYLAKLHGARIEYSQPGYDESTEHGLAMKAVDQLVSGLERLDIRRRTMGGKRALAEKGRVIATPNRPYGYDFESKYDERGRKTMCELVVRTDEEPSIVQRIFDMYVYEGLSTYAIAKRLTAMGVSTMGDKEKKTRPRRHFGVWAHNTIAAILNNSTYMGEWRYAKRRVQQIDTAQGVRQHYLTLDAPDSIVVEVPAIVSRQLWTAAQEQMVENRRKFRRPTVQVYPLRGRLRCARCSYIMIGMGTPRKTGTYRVYRCGRSNPEYGQYRCPTNTVDAQHVENEVWEVVRAAMLDEDRLTVAVHKRQQEASQSRRVIEGALAALVALDAKGQAKLGRYLNLYGEGEMTKEAYLAQKREIESELAKRATERAEMEQRLAECPVLTPDQEVQLAAFRHSIASRMNGEVPATERAKLFELLRLQCVYDSESGEVAVSGLMGEQQLSITSRCGSRPARRC